MSLLIRGARVLTIGTADRPRRGASLGELGVLPNADVVIENGQVLSVTPRDPASAPPTPGGCSRVIDAGGRVLMPAFIDCHTHACWAGDRLDEWEQKLGGATYQQIMERGGGIMSTVRAVRSAGVDDLAEGLLARLRLMQQCGTCTVEVKSGYGLTPGDELKVLRAIRRAADRWNGTVVATALLGHAIDPDDPGFVQTTIERTLPAVSEEFPGITIDAYCERGAWSAEQCVALFDRAVSLGHPFRVHADQFSSMGMLPAAVRMGAVSVDHLEASTPTDLAVLAGSSTFGVILPCCGFHLDGRYANGRQLLAAGGAVGGGLLALATNVNPGSAPCHSMSMAIAVAARHCGLSPAQAIGASTVNPAALLGFSDRGGVVPGQRADLVLLRHRDERMLAYEFGENPVENVICNGTVV